MKQLLRTVLLACAVLPVCVASAETSPTLRFLGNSALPPVVWSHNGKAEGVAVDLARAAAQKAGLSIDVQGADWQQAQNELALGKADALVQINPTPQRLALFDFSAPLLQSNFHIFRQNRNLNVTDLNSLSGKRVGVEPAGFPITFLKDHGQIQVVTVADWKDAFEKLRAGQIDAVFVDRWVGEYVLFQYKIGDIVLVDPPVISIESRIAVRKGNVALLASINKGLREIDEDGTRRAILEKWQAKEVVYLTREALDRIVVVGSVSLAAVLLAFSSWLYWQGRRLQKNNIELKSRMLEITALQVKLNEQVIRDPLTGLHNRRYLDETLPRDLARAKREGRPLAIIMLDLDFFKRVNDTYGHAGGDEVLKVLSTILADQARKSDIVCRYGGEEFLVALPRITSEQAVAKAEQWQERLRLTAIKHGEFTINTTLSAGVAVYPDHGAEIETLIYNADQALYASKKAGRNRVTSFNAIER